jgi:hypothetical protein
MAMVFEFFSRNKEPVESLDTELSEEHCYHRMSEGSRTDTALNHNTATRRRSTSAPPSEDDKEILLLQQALQAAKISKQKRLYGQISKAMQDGIRSKPFVITEESTEKRNVLGGFQRQFDAFVAAEDFTQALDRLNSYIRYAAKPRNGREFANTHSFKEFVQSLRQQGSDDAIEIVYNHYLIILMKKSIEMVPENQLWRGDNRRDYLQTLCDSFVNTGDWNQKKQAFSLFENNVIETQSGCQFFPSDLKITVRSGLTVLEELDPDFRKEQSTLVMS